MPKSQQLFFYEVSCFQPRFISSETRGVSGNSAGLLNHMKHVRIHAVHLRSTHTHTHTHTQALNPMQPIRSHSWFAWAVVMTSLHTVLSFTVWVGQQEHPPAVFFPKKPPKKKRCRTCSCVDSPSIMFTYVFFDSSSVTIRCMWQCDSFISHLLTPVFQHQIKPRVNSFPCLVPVHTLRGKYGLKAI